MKFEAFAHQIQKLEPALAELEKMRLTPDEYRYFPQEQRLLLIYLDFNTFHRCLRQSVLNVSPGFSKSCLLIRNGWRNYGNIKAAAEKVSELAEFEYSTTEFGSHLLIYVTKGNVKKCLAAFQSFVEDVSINSQFYEQQLDSVYLIKHDFVELEDMNE